jgi:hypothetical protein
MKRLSFILIALSLPFSLMVGCQQSFDKTPDLQARIDSLQNKVNSAYVPGTGEIMNGIVQPHHLKLWLAGQNKNWELAEYETHMLMGGFNRIQKYHKGKPEAASVVMAFPAMDAIEKAIRDKDINSFKSNYAVLTYSCNTCHQALNCGFNAVTVPSASGGNFDNQSFKSAH